MLHIRKSLLLRDILASELEQPAARPVTRAVAPRHPGSRRPVLDQELGADRAEHSHADACD